MKKLNLFAVALATTALTFTTACSDDSDDSTDASNPPGGGGNSPTVNSYSGSATYGDLVTFSINKTEGSYTLNNETTGQTESGNYTVSTDTYFKGVYQVSAGGNTFFGIELDDKIVTANFPSGNSSNDLSFGVSSEIDNSGRLNEIAGDYFYVKLGSYLANGNPMEWGVFTAGTDSIWGVTEASGNNGPEDITINRPLDYSVSDFDLSYTVNNDRLTISDGSGSNLTGYVYAAGNTSVFLIDQGTGMGTYIAYKIDDNFNPANSTGNYKFIDFATDGTKGAGNYNIDANGNVKYSWTDGTAANTVTDISLNSALTQSNIPNVWYAYNVNSDGDNLYLVVAGDAIMHYVFDRNFNFIEYGAGAKL